MLSDVQGWTVTLQLQREAEGSLVGLVKDEAGGMISVVPYYSYRDSWVRFDRTPL